MKKEREGTARSVQQSFEKMVTKEKLKRKEVKEGRVINWKKKKKQGRGIKIFGQENEE